MPPKDQSGPIDAVRFQGCFDHLAGPFHVEDMEIERCVFALIGHGPAAYGGGQNEHGVQVHLQREGELGAALSVAVHGYL